MSNAPLFDASQSGAALSTVLAAARQDDEEEEKQSKGGSVAQVVVTEYSMPDDKSPSREASSDSVAIVEYEEDALSVLPAGDELPEPVHRRSKRRRRSLQCDTIGELLAGPPMEQGSGIFGVLTRTFWSNSRF